MTMPNDGEPPIVAKMRKTAASQDGQAWLLPLEIGTAWWNMMVDLSFGPATVHHRQPDHDRR